MPRVRLKGLSTRGDILIAMSGEEQRARYLLVRSGGRSYGVAADQVRHVVRGLLCHPVPGSRPHLLGLAQYGGEPLAVLDLQALLEKGRPRANYRATVVLGRRGRRSRTMIGLAVDEARRVVRRRFLTLGRRTARDRHHDEHQGSGHPLQQPRKITSHAKSPKMRGVSSILQDVRQPAEVHRYHHVQ